MSGACIERDISHTAPMSSARQREHGVFGVGWGTHMNPTAIMEVDSSKPAQDSILARVKASAEGQPEWKHSRATGSTPIGNRAQPAHTPITHTKSQTHTCP
jgi:hypothetical protein